MKFIVSAMRLDQRFVLSQWKLYRYWLITTYPILSLFYDYPVLYAEVDTCIVLSYHAPDTSQIYMLYSKSAIRHETYVNPAKSNLSKTKALLANVEIKNNKNEIASMVIVASQ